jgi:hypothetical protein
MILEGVKSFERNVVAGHAFVAGSFGNEPDIFAMSELREKDGGLPQAWQHEHG